MDEIQSSEFCCFPALVYTLSFPATHANQLQLFLTEVIYSKPLSRIADTRALHEFFLLASSFICRFFVLLACMFRGVFSRRPTVSHNAALLCNKLPLKDDHWRIFYKNPIVYALSLDSATSFYDTGSQPGLREHLRGPQM